MDKFWNFVNFVKFWKNKKGYAEKDYDNFRKNITKKYNEKEIKEFEKTYQKLENQFAEKWFSNNSNNDQFILSIHLD